MVDSTQAKPAGLQLPNSDIQRFQCGITVSFSTMKMTYPTWYPLRMKNRSQEYFQCYIMRAR